jgi:hypothetical protein
MFGALFSTNFLNALKAVFGKTKYQKKENVVSSSVDGIKIQFNNLEIGKAYRFTGQAGISVTDGTNLTVNFKNGATQVGRIRFYGGQGLETGTGDVFVATATVFTVEASNFANAFSRVLNYSKATIEELPNHEVTTDWT